MSINSNTKSFCPYRYYYNTLSRKQQHSYKALLNGYLHHKTHIRIGFQSLDEISIVNQALINDAPELFFLDNYRYTYYDHLKVAEIEPFYLYDSTTSNRITNEINNSVSQVINLCINKSDFEKVKNIHDYLLNSIRYAETKDSHSIVGALTNGYAVCEGIAKAFKYIADKVGLKSVIVYGNAKTNGTNIVQSHSWNIVYVNGVMYHVDVTFDLTLSDPNGIQRYDYLLLSDIQIMNDHYFTALTNCCIEYEYYENIGLYANNRSSLERMIENSLGRNDTLIVKLPTFTNNIEFIAQIILDIVSKTISKAEGGKKEITVNYNESRMIFEIKMLEVS